MLASRLRPELVRVEPLALDHPAIADAAKALQRTVEVYDNSASPGSGCHRDLPS
ncbi:hypothetical protein P3H15_25160 [Rhodococcus sp. T2V]|uniref:hypothetical protein n=1 Tax=Rhodococcus sp. T2V TaxID=3034164 RepID=UPI0023E11184|nr:hypothetical protein [Rhodococcus sp. T2V]MDF3308311.1 hypothetical protein [Rhodococcus sp. T2V]